MLHKLTVFALLVFFYGSTNATVIEFQGTLKGADDAARQLIMKCINPNTPDCKSFVDMAYNSIKLVLESNAIDGLRHHTISVTADDQTKTGAIHVQLNFTNPQLRGVNINLECSVFPTLLETALFQLTEKITMDNVKFIKPKPAPIVLNEETVTLIVVADLLEYKKPFDKDLPDNTTDTEIQTCMKQMIYGNQICSPLYNSAYIMLNGFQYKKEDKVTVQYNVEYNSNDLKNIGLDPTCPAFPQFLQDGLANSPSRCRFTLGQNVQVKLKAITLSTASSATTTEQPGSQSTGGTATTVNGKKLIYLFTWIVLFVPHFM